MNKTHICWWVLSCFIYYSDILISLNINQLNVWGLIKFFQNKTLMCFIFSNCIMIPMNFTLDKVLLFCIRTNKVQTFSVIALKGLLYLPTSVLFIAYNKSDTNAIIYFTKDLVVKIIIGVKAKFLHTAIMCKWCLQFWKIKNFKNCPNLE